MKNARICAAVLVVAAALALAVVGSRSSSPYHRVGADGGGRAVLSTPTDTGSAAGTVGAPKIPSNSVILQTLTTVYIVAFLVALAIVLVGLVLVRPRLVARRRARLMSGTGPAEPEYGAPRGPTAQELAAAVEQGLARLDEGPVTDAIIGCWIELERAAAAAGTERRPAETAAELTERVLAAHRVQAGVLRSLAGLYREARFSGHELLESDRARARRLLDEVRHDLGSRV